MKDLTLAVSCINRDSNVPTINKDSICRACENKNNIYKENLEAFEGQKKATKKMIEVSDEKFKTIN